MSQKRSLYALGLVSIVLVVLALGYGLRRRNWTRKSTLPAIAMGKGQGIFRSGEGGTQPTMTLFPQVVDARASAGALPIRADEPSAPILDGDFLVPCAYPDGSVLQALNPTGGGPAILLKLDPWGSPLWSGAEGPGLRFPRMGRLMTMATTPDGGCLAVGGAVDMRPGGGLLLLRLDGSGRSLWNSEGMEGQRFGEAEDTIHTVQPLPDGSCALLGSTQAFAKRPQAWILRYDVNGRSQWNTGSREGLVFESEGNERFKAVRMTADKGLVLIGCTGADTDTVLGVNNQVSGWGSRPVLLTQSPLPPRARGTLASLNLTSRQRMAWMLRLDASGKSLWNVGNYAGVAYRGATFEALEIGKDQKIWVAGAGCTDLSRGSDGYLRCFNAEGQSLLSMAFYDGLIFASPRGGGFFAIQLLADGGCLLLGKAGVRDEDRTANWLARVDADGGSLWNPSEIKSGLGSSYYVFRPGGQPLQVTSVPYPGILLDRPGASPLRYIRAHPEGGWILGSAWAGPEGAAWILRLPENGHGSYGPGWLFESNKDLDLAPPVPFRGGLILAGTSDGRMWEARIDGNGRVN